MTKLTTSREIHLASRPGGIPTAANFTLAETTLPPLQAQQVLVRNLFMSVDPYMRGRMNEGKSYVPPFVIGQPLEGGAIGEVVESLASEFKPGASVNAKGVLYRSPGLAAKRPTPGVTNPPPPNPNGVESRGIASPG